MFNKILSNDGLVSFQYRSYGTFFLQQNRLHNSYGGSTHYRNYRVTFNKMKTEESLINLSEFLGYFLFIKVIIRFILTTKMVVAACNSMLKRPDALATSKPCLCFSSAFFASIL